MKEESLVTYPVILGVVWATAPVIRAFAVIIVAKCVNKELAKMAIPLLLQPLRFRGQKPQPTSKEDAHFSKY
jgi:hypothetical protein